MNIKIYSSTNCTITVKAIQWLEKKNLSYQFVDLESRALSNKEVKELCSFENADIEQLFTTWSFEFKKIKAGLPKKTGRSTSIFVQNATSSFKTSFDHHR